MTFAKDNAAEEGFNRWTINGVAYPMSNEMAPASFHLKQGKRYRIRMRNASDDIHPIHLHRHSFELTNIAGKPMAECRRMFRCWEATKKQKGISVATIRVRPCPPPPAARHGLGFMTRSIRPRDPDEQVEPGAETGPHQRKRSSRKRGLRPFRKEFIAS